jgi:DNA-binding response OmpR family regulator
MVHKKVLLVDDNEDYTRLLTKNLIHDGFETRVAHSGLDALDMISSNNYTPDLLLVDLMMPNMDGLELLEKIKKKKLSSRSKICILSAKNNMGEIAKAFDLGAHEYFLKSDNLVVMLEKLYELMEIERRPRPDKKGDFISVLEVTNVIHDFKIIDFDENTVTFESAEELPLNSTVQIKNEKLKKFKNSKHPISCQVQECRIEDDQIIVSCNYLYDMAG